MFLFSGFKATNKRVLVRARHFRIRPADAELNLGPHTHSLRVLGPWRKDCSPWGPGFLIFKTAKNAKVITRGNGIPRSALGPGPGAGWKSVAGHKITKSLESRVVGCTAEPCVPSVAVLLTVQADSHREP